MKKSKKGHHFFSQAAVLLCCITAVNAGNYAINILLGKYLGPEIFAEASVLATAVLIISFISLSFQLATAKYVAEHTADNNINSSEMILIHVRKMALYAGLAVSFILMATVPLIKEFFHFNTALPLWIIAISVPVYFVMSVHRGYLQGKQFFGRLAGSYVAEMLGRLMVTIFILLLLLKAFPAWISTGIALSFLCSFIAAWAISYTRLNQEEISTRMKPDLKPIISFMLVAGLYEFSQVLINHSDLLLVKHFFSNEEAGCYAALALVGRIVFFATWSIVLLMIPKVIEQRKKGFPHGGLLIQSLGLVGMTGALIILACFAFSNQIVGFVFSSDYAMISPLLWKYALMTCFFACANVFAYYYMSLDNYTPVAITIIAGISQLVAMWLYHNSLNEILFIQLILMIILFGVMIIFHLNKSLSNEKNQISSSYSLTTG